MFKLQAILEYDHIVIQCHDNPDADAIGSAFALYSFLAEHGKDAEIVYSGFSEIQKANLVLMVSALNIPLRYISRDADGYAWTASAESGRALLLTVDCQHGAGNVKNLLPAAGAETETETGTGASGGAIDVCIIDHHVKETEEPPLCDIRPFLGSCSTLVWRLLCDAGFDFRKNTDVGTALYYGLYTDTNSLAEIIHPLDMDLRDSVKYDAGLIKKLKNSNLSLSDLEIAGKTLTTHWIFTDTRSAIFEAEPCDPNILGFTSDLALQVDNIDACVVFCKVSGGVKISVRSCVRETMANELASKLCEGVGSGGGHKDKAGGFISADKLQETGAASAEEFIKDRMAKYFGEYDLVYAGQPIPDLDPSKMEQYRKKEIPIGYVRTVDVFPEDTELIVRTIEGDTHIAAGPDIYIMVGVCQEIWPIKAGKFKASYRELDTRYAPSEELWDETHYKPTAKSRIEGESISLLPYIRSCVPTGEGAILAKALKKRTKVFTSWNQEGYMFGDAGDYLAVRADDPADAYIIEKTIFLKTYEAIT